MSYMFLLAFDRTSWTEPLSFRLARQRDTRKVKPLNRTLQTHILSVQANNSNLYKVDNGSILMD